MRGLNWGDERYVRLFTRDTASWKKLSWRARGLYALLRRTADRAGVIDDLDDREAVAAQVDAREDRPGVSAALDELVAGGWVEEHVVPKGLRLVIPEFIESEETQTLPAARQRTLRERRRDQGRLREPPMTVTPASHAAVTHERNANVTPPLRDDVTPASHAAVTHDVTLASPLPSVPSVPVLPGDVARPGAPDAPARSGEGDQRRRGGSGPEPDERAEAIRQKLLRMPAPIQYLEQIRAQERFASACIGGQATLDDVLTGIDSAALKLGKRLGAVSAEDEKGLDELERFVAGCIAKQPMIRKSIGGGAPPGAGIPRELIEHVLSVFAERYERARWGYGRYLRGDDDETHAGTLARFALREGGGLADGARGFVEHVIEAFLADEFYGRQRHALRWLAQVLEREPARYGTPRPPDVQGASAFEDPEAPRGERAPPEIAARLSGAIGGAGKPAALAPAPSGRRPSRADLERACAGDEEPKRAQG